jgi:hypothetical protein
VIVTIGVGVGVAVGTGTTLVVDGPLDVGWPAEAVVVGRVVCKPLGVTGAEQAAKAASTTKDKARNGWATAH